MAYEKTNAITIRYADYSDTSRVLTFYTRRFGRVSALAKGAKRRYSRLIGHVDLLSFGEIVFISGRTRDRLHILTEACAFETFPAIRKDLARLYAACHAVQLVNAMTAEDDPSPELFDRLLGLLRWLGQGIEPAAPLFAFEAHLLVLTGFMPELSSCVSCGKPNRQRTTAFSSALGGILCERCSAGQTDVVPDVPSGALNLLERLARGKLTRLDRIRVAPQVVASARTFLNHYETYILGRELGTTKDL